MSRTEMQVSGLVALVVAGWLFPACGVDVVEFTISQEGQAGLAGLSLPGMPSFGASLTQELNNRDVKGSDVDSMKLLGCSIRLTSQGALTNDLAFLEKLEFYVRATGKEPVLLASQPSFPQGTKAADLQVTSGLELKPYLDAGGMAVDVEAPLVYPPPDLVTFTVSFTIRVDVNVI